jgi:hypothetical protein
MLLTNFGFWEFWENFPQKVTFDGPNKIIWVNTGETVIDVQIDLYSNWKEWVEYRDNSQYPKTFNSVGGDETPTGEVGGTYFLENDWKIKPWAGNYVLQVAGNMYARDGSDPFVGAEGTTYKVTILQTVSNIVDTVATGGGGVGEGIKNTEAEIHAWLESYLGKEGWKGLTPTQENTIISTNLGVQDIQTDVTNIKSTVNSLPSLLDIEGSAVLAKKSDISVVEAICNTLPVLTEIREELINVQFGGLEIVNNQLTLKDKAGITIAIFDLFDKNGNPTMLSVFKREVVL